MPTKPVERSMDETCQHPYDAVKELTVDARYDNRPLNRTRLDFCTECGDILDVQDEDEAIIEIKSWSNSCDHPFSAVEMRDIEIVHVGGGRTLQTILTEICTDCDGPAQRETLLELDFQQD